MRWIQKKKKKKKKIGEIGLQNYQKFQDCVLNGFYVEKNYSANYIFSKKKKKKDGLI